LPTGKNKHLAYVTSQLNEKTIMIIVRKAAERGHANHGWLDSYHSFSFGSYHDPAHMGFSDLRVINQDIVAAGQGFDIHAHANMEIISYVLRGTVEHKDSLGTIATIRAGDVQRMTAGTGIRHSEYNPSPSEETEFLQIWILPEANDLTPGYEQKNFGAANANAPLQLVASRDGRESSVIVHQDLSLYRGLMQGGESISYKIGSRKTWAQVVRGSISINDHHIELGDGAAISNVTEIQISANTNAEFLLFDLRA
jgi:quercetin 2,3-dioxygenase